jgi:hypothetical protein
MSIIIELLPQCDICSMTNADMRHEAIATKAAMRRHMKGEGWTRRGKKDICPICSGTDAPCSMDNHPMISDCDPG